MPPARRVLLVRCVLGALLALALLAFWRVDFRRKVSTDVLDLIPGAERSPELALVRSLASEQQARVILLALDLPAGSPHRDAAAAAFLASLQTAPGIAEAVPMTDRTARETLGRALFERRLDLLLPGWLAARRRDYAAARTDQPWPAS